MVSKKQEEILNYINKTINTKGYSPTVREICEAVGLKSTSTVQYHLKKLINLGYLNKSDNISRSITSRTVNTQFGIPILGEISAGQPLLAEENYIGELPYFGKKINTELIALKINGDSMIDAGLYNDDLVVIDKSIIPSDGDIGAFLIHNTEATVKYVGTIADKRYLIPANKNYSNIEVDENITQIGKVVSLFRDM
ncbi:MAG: repressor LexA [Candidatus Actinomarinales bacterium]|nr:MAG: repressor LexA [Candidatus Actinomarinales bacterium]|tara:strand:+ start:4031 stop:4618 length:588 start_codon:yes stop_codon:yes gene_type:complete